MTSSVSKGLPGRSLLISTAIAFALALVAPRHASAQEGAGAGAGSAAGDKAVGEDDALYKCGKGKGPVAVNFKPDVELKDLITWAMGFTCKNFLYGSGISGRSSKVTIIAPKKMSPQEAYRVFLVALTTMNLAVVPKGNVLKIVEAPQAKGESVPVYRKGGVANDDEIVRLVMRPSHISVDEMARALEMLKSQNGTVAPLPSAGAILVTDHGSHIQTMVTLSRELDQPVAGERVYMIKVNYADAGELAEKLNEILGVREGAAQAPAAGGGGGRRRGAAADSQGKGDAPAAPSASVAEVETAVPKRILADARTNSLIILSSEAGYLRVRALVKRLDVAIDVEGGGHIHVYYLDNAQAEEMATTLNAVITGIQQPTTGTGAAGGRGGRQAQQQQPAAQPQTQGAREGSGVTFEGQVRVTHDAPTNALVVVASAKDFLALREVVRKLDQPRRQVFIEAVILEAKVSNSLTLGSSFHGGYQTDDGALILGGLQGDLRSTVPSSLGSVNGLIGGVLGPLLPGTEELLGISIPSYGVLFQALATNGNINVLSSPHILTTDNEEATISVGENIPYQSQLAGAAAQAGAFGIAGPQIQRTDIALTLKIKPHVNASEMVRLEIDLEIADVAERDFEGLGPSWSKRTIKTPVSVRDQQSIVIGGLMSDRATYNESKIPLLGDIPILGYLFKSTVKTKSKTNLLVLLTPYIIKDQMDIEHIVQRKVRERAEFLRTVSAFNRTGFLPEVDFRRKRGLIEEINRQVQLVERERELLLELERKSDSFPDGPIEYEGATDEPDDDDGGTTAEGGDGTSTTNPPATEPAPGSNAPASPATPGGGGTTPKRSPEGQLD